MRWLEPTPRDAEFPTRYTLDEARFPGGRDRIHNKEENEHEPAADYT